MSTSSHSIMIIDNDEICIIHYNVCAVGRHIFTCDGRGADSAALGYGCVGTAVS